MRSSVARPLVVWATISSWVLICPMLSERNRSSGGSGYSRRIRERSRDIYAAIALTLAALTLLGLTFANRSPAPQPVASTADFNRN
jgi:hypothetical protein